MKEKSIKILVISDYRPTISVRPEAEIYIGLARLGIDVNVMTYEESEYVQKFRKEGIRVIPFHPEKKLDKKEIRFIREELQQGKYDFLFLYNSVAILNGIQAAKKLPVKVVLYRGFEGHIHWYDPTAYLKYLHPRVDYIICNAEGITDYFRRNTFISPSKLITINKGHRLAWYQDIQAHNRADLSFKKEDFLVICVANNRKMKGMPYLFNAMNHLPPNLPIHLLLVGNGMDAPELLAIKNKSPYKNNIHILGFRKDALQLVAMSDVFALASLFGESITKAVLEAMALGIAPIITDIAGNRELVEHQKNGLVVPKKNAKALADGIIELYENPNKHQQFGEASQERIATFLSSERSIREMYAFLDKVLSS